MKFVDGDLPFQLLFVKLLGILFEDLVLFAYPEKLCLVVIELLSEL